MKNSRLKTNSGSEGEIFSTLAFYDVNSIVQSFYTINIDGKIVPLPLIKDVSSTIVFLNISSTIAKDSENPILGSLGTITNYVKNQLIGNFYIDQYTLRIQLTNFSFVFKDQVLTLRNPTSFTVLISKINGCDETREYRKFRI
jgi:hypothetical protein